MDGESYHSNIFVEFALELSDVAGVINSLVKATGKFRRDGLQWYFGIGDSTENDKEFCRRLGSVGLVNGYFRYEVIRPLPRRDLLVHFFRLLDGEEVFTGNSFQISPREF